MKYILKSSFSKPFFRIKNNIVFEVNNEFENLTGYSREKMLGKSIAEISNMLRIDSQVYLEEIVSEFSCYIFTKEYETREVTISRKRIQSENEQIYFIKEKVNSRIEHRLPYVVSILSDNKIGVAIYSIPDLNILKANQKFSDYFNKITCNKIENYIGKSLKEIFPEYKGSKFENVILNIIKTGETYDAKEIKYNCPNKGATYWDESFVTIYILGKAKYIVHTVDDVTEKVVIRNIIEEQKQEMEAIIENISDELIIFNKCGRYTKINKAARANSLIDYKTHKKLGDINGQFKLYDMDGNYISHEKMPTTRVIRGEKITNFRVVKKNSNDILYKEIDGTPIYDSEGNLVAGVLVIRDITERLKYEENLYMKAQYSSLSNIVENLELGFVRFTYPELNIIDVNNKAINMLKQLNPSKCSQSSINGKNIFDLLDGDDEEVRIIESMQNYLRTNSNSFTKTIKHNVAGEEIFFKTICQPLFGLNNEIIEIVVIAIDVTEEEKAKNRMVEALEVQDEIYANVSHELKTPLNVIFSANQLMELYLNNDSIEANNEKLSNYNSCIKQNCYRLIKLINNIVDLSKIKSKTLKFNPSNVNIVGIIENISQSVWDYVKSKELSIVFDTDIEDKIIACDPEKIERIMLNLISNAIKFSNKGDNIYINVSDKGEFVEISVKDTGIGIDNKSFDSIFDRFYQEDKSLSRNAEGSGIGLSLVKSIVDIHGGKISVESEVGKGSTFKIEIPSKLVENSRQSAKVNMNNKIEMINIEFSDIYSND